MWNFTTYSGFLILGEPISWGTLMAISINAGGAPYPGELLLCGRMRRVCKAEPWRNVLLWDKTGIENIHRPQSSNHSLGAEMLKVSEQWTSSCNFFLWECLGLCVLFLYFAEPAYELALKFVLEFRNPEIYSKDYGEDFFSAKWTVIFQTIDSCHIDFQACREIKSLLTWDCQSFGSLACDA